MKQITLIATLTILTMLVLGLGGEANFESPVPTPAIYHAYLPAIYGSPIPIPTVMPTPTETPTPTPIPMPIYHIYLPVIGQG